MRCSLVATILLAACSGATVRSMPVEQPNIVLILADDLGIGELGAWGQTEIATPAIDQLAREGMRLTAFRSSAAVCGPARCSLMLGLHNGHCRLDDNDSDYLRTSDETLAERLRAVGYATGLFGKWGLSYDAQPESWPQAQGFDAFFGYRDQVHAHNFYPEFLIDGTDSLRTGNVVPKPTRMGAGAASLRRAYAPDLIRDRAFAFIRANASRPFFVYWATNLPHIHNETMRTAADGGYEIPTLGPYADKPWPLPKRSYAAQVHRLDQDVAAIRALLDSLGVADRTLIVFASDNGATFLQVANDGTTDIAGRWFKGTLGFRGFKGDLYEGGLRVPGIVHWPGRVNPGTTSAVAADFTDLHATLLEAAGAVRPSTIDGQSLLPILTGERTSGGRSHLVWYSPDRRQAAVLEGRYKAVWMRDTMRVFDLETDAGETTDLRAMLPEVAARLDAIRQREDGRRP